MKTLPTIRRGRGANHNPPNRFERLHVHRDEWIEEGDPSPRTQFFKDGSRTIVAFNDSPDVGFAASVNPYRGCEHGCVYCYARPTHEYLGYSAGRDFESKIMVKEDAPVLLRRQLMAPSWEPQPVAMSGVTDPYQPVERRLGLTRKCLEVLNEFRNPVVIVTKSHVITRDTDILRELAELQAVVVYVSVTTLDHRMQRIMEPRAPTPARRLAAIEKLSEAGIPVGVMMAPIIPGLNDREIPAVLAAVADAGAVGATFVTLRLPLAVAGIFERWLGEHYPDRKKQVISKIRAMRGGKLNDPSFGTRMRGRGSYAKQISDLFEVAKRKVGLDGRLPPITAEHFRRPGEGKQLDLGV